MDQSLSISNFIPQYPDPEDPNFNYDILRKVEFYDLRLKSSESKPDTQGELLDSQKILKRFFAPETTFNKSLFQHDPGTGKCVHPETMIDIYLNGRATKQRALDLWLYFSGKQTTDGIGIWATPTINIEVDSYDGNKYVKRPIKNFYRQNVNEKIKKIVLSTESYIEITKAHKLYVKKDEDDPAWTTDILIGDHVMTRGGFKEVKDIIIYSYEGFVYDFEIEEYHNYIANGVVAHNTCLSSAIIESSKNLEVGGKRRKRALVIVKNDGLRRKYMKDVATVCTSGEYLPKHTEKELRKGVDISKEAQIRRLKTEVTKTYEIVTIETFLKNLPDSDDVIKSVYSNRDIIIDEAHVLRIQPGGKSKKVEGGAEGETAEPKINSKMYQKMHKFLHTVENARVLLFTGTPIWDDTSEIASLMNLILDLDKQLPTGKEFDKAFFKKGELRKGSADILKKLFKGKVSYLRKMTTNAKREEIGTSKPWLEHIKVFPDKMSKEQTLYVRKARKTEEGKGSAFSADARSASNMIIPIFNKDGEIEDYDYTSETFKKYATKRRKTLTGEESSISYYISNNLLRNYIKNHLEQISAKFASIIEDLKANPKEVTFIYNEFVAAGTGGAIMLALCLEIHGFVWVKNANQIKNPSNQRRFAVITSDKETTHQATQIEELLESSNKPDNKYGDRLQVIIGSEKIALGMDIFNVRKMHVATPYWNLASLEQAKARGFRFGGLDALPKEERYIKIMNHVAVEGGGDYDFEKGVGFPTNKGFSDRETIDIHVYKIAEAKEYKNTQIYRILKEVAYDCGLFYKRNVLENDVDGSRDCDYQKCKYKCDGLKPNKKYPTDPYRLDKKELDYSTFNLLYGKPHAYRMIDLIVELFHNYFSLDIYAIMKLLDINENMLFILVEALNIIIETRLEIRDRFGFPRFLKEDGNVYFLDTTTSGSTRYLEAAYVENPLVSDITDFQDLVDIMELQNDEEQIPKFCEKPSEKNFDKLSYKTKIVLLEESYKRGELGKEPSDVEDFILGELGDDIYVMSDDTPVHILYSSEFKGTSFDISTKKITKPGEMRYFDKKDKEWKNVTDVEKETLYLEEIKAVDLEEDSKFDKNPYGIYGILSKKDNKFRIRLKPEPGKRTSGLVCSSFDEADLRDIFVSKLKKFPRSKKDYKNLDKDKLVEIIKGIPGSVKYRKTLEKHDAEYLRGLLTVLTLTKTELCEQLKKMLEKLKILYSK